MPTSATSRTATSAWLATTAAELGSLEDQITEVSLRYGVLCRFTAFVAVDSRVVTDGGVPHRVTQPVELPAGWDPVGFGLPRAAVASAALGAVAKRGRMMPMRAAAGPTAAAMPSASRSASGTRALAPSASAARTASSRLVAS